MRIYAPTLALLFAGLLCFGDRAMAEARPVELQKTEQGWQLLRDGEPYFIRGAGGDASLELLAAAGANSVRTWGADDIGDRLDEAHALGLSVTVGIWLAHERHGFDYSDSDQVAKQFEYARQIIIRYKDHPAVLLWGIGNEMEGFEDGDDPAIWTAVNDIAAMAKELDPNHPTMSVTAFVHGQRIKYLHEHSPDIDIHGVNAYGGAQRVPELLRAGGATKPFVLTEFGPPGSWETATADWGAPIEMTSTQKAAFYKRTYETAVAGQPGLALGSYAFTWGYKMEATATWFGLFLEDGSKLGAVDALTELWSGKSSSNLAPVVSPLVVESPVEVEPGAEIQIRAGALDPEGGPVTVRWALRSESGEYATGGDFRRMLPDIESAVIESDAASARVRMPDEPGQYRLFYYAYDEGGNAATANVPLLVMGEVRTHLPFPVYEDGFEGMPWAPSGWMGSIDELELDGENAEDAYDGSASIKMRYEGKYGWVGVAWQNPANNWGDADGGFDLTGASELELWARGEYGGEKIGIGVGIIGADKPHPDSGKTTVEGIVLTREWQRLTVPLKKLDLASIKTGFVITLTGRETPVTIYLDNIRYIR